MSVDSPGSQTGFEEDEITKPIAKPLAPNPEKEPAPKPPLTFDEFCTWNGDIPVWLNFYLRFYKKWASNIYKDEEWLQKLYEIKPELCAEISRRIEKYQIFWKNLEEQIKNGKIATNVNKTSKINFFRQLEPLLYQAYWSARMCAVNDNEFFLINKSA